KQQDPLLDVTVVPADAHSGLVEPDAIVRAVRSGETALICVNHVSNVTGTIQDLVAIGQACAHVGVGANGPNAPLLLSDGAQSLGHVDVDMPAMNIDLLAFPGHKGLLGPTGVGGLCIRPGVEKLLSPVREGGTGNRSEEPTQPETLPEKYEAG